MPNILHTPPAELGTILSIWAHPDDETYLAGGIMAAARDHGRRVVCVTASSGEHGTDDPGTWPPHRLGQIRRWEADAAMAILGVIEHHVLGYADGGLRADDLSAIDMIGAGVARVTVEVLTLPEGVVRVGASGELRGFEVMSRLHPVGTLMVLSPLVGGEPLVVRVVSQELPIESPADVVVGYELYAAVGSEARLHLD